jgi:hypothetical protein
MTAPTEQELAQWWDSINRLSVISGSVDGTAWANLYPEAKEVITTLYVSALNCHAAHQAKLCPNCRREAPGGLFSHTDHGVTHCGCYYSRPEGVHPNYTAEKDARR